MIVDDLPFDAPAGHVLYRRAPDGQIVGMQFGCPCGCGSQYGATFKGGGWMISGDESAPTVSPSLGCYPAGNGVGPDRIYHWHGFLRAGVFEEC